MLFASDLDRTLIYSERFLDAYTGRTSAVERYEGRDISHMSMHAIELLKQLYAQLLFVPTTTRSVEQYKRISLFQDVLPPRYAIVANGGIILKNNEVDPVWQRIIQDKMSSIPSPEQLIQNQLDFFNREDIKLFRTCDNLFAYAVFHQRPDQIDGLLQLSEQCAAQGYLVAPNGRKIYFIPTFMTKWAAVQHIMEQEGISTSITSGDSMLDESLILNCDHGVIPLHGELAAFVGTRIPARDTLTITRTEGLAASCELLTHALSIATTMQEKLT